MLRSRLIVTTAALGLGVTLVAPAVPANAQTVSIIFVEPVVPTQSDVAAVAERQALGAPRQMTDLKNKALSEIAKRQRTLADLTAKVSASTRNCGTNGAMLTEIATTAAGLTALGQVIAAETDVTRARAAFEQIYTSFRVYLLVAPKAGQVIRCNGQMVRIDQIRADAAQVQAAINAGPGTGIDTTAAQLLLNQALASLASVNPALALAGIVGLVPDRGVEAARVANAAALKSADAALDASNRALRNVQEQLSAARKAAQRSGQDADKARRELEQAKKKAEHDAEKARDKASHDAEKARRALEQAREKAERDADKLRKKAEKDLERKQRGGRSDSRENDSEGDDD